MPPHGEFGFKCSNCGVPLLRFEVVQHHQVLQGLLEAGAFHFYLQGEIGCLWDLQRRLIQLLPRGACLSPSPTFPGLRGGMQPSY